MPMPDVVLRDDAVGDNRIRVGLWSVINMIVRGHALVRSRRSVRGFTSAPYRRVNFHRGCKVFQS